MSSLASSVAISETAVPNSNHGYKLYVGDCIEALRLMADQSVNCCVTSPPYYGLRDYGVDGQIGLEETPEQFIARLVEVFREVRRVLRDDGVLWVNIGDSYASRANGSVGNSSDGYNHPHVSHRTKHARRSSHIPNGYKHKDLIGIPWMLAFALRADGWYLRQDIIWNKPNPMPESVRDRCTKAHEYIFLLSKSRKYFFDNEALKEDAKTPPMARDKSAEGYQANYAHGDRFSAGERVYGADGKRNRRSVWNIATKPYKGAHFAVFHPELIEPCILAGCPVGGVVLDPFGGSGTTAGVAIKHGRDAVLCELNPEYAELIPARIESIVLAKPKKQKKVQAESLPEINDNKTLDMFAWAEGNL